MERRRLRLLLVEDNTDDALLVQELIATINRDPVYEYVLEQTHVATIAAARRALEQGTHDAALLDLTLPETAGLEALRTLAPYLAETPVIVLTGPDDHRLAAEAIRLGAQDYIVKGKSSSELVLRSIRYSVERHRMAVMLHHAAFVDELTGLYNRRGFLRLAGHQISLSRRKGRGYSLTFADVDGMRQINDQHGRQEGDEALVRAAELLRASYRESDVIGRIGGDEFVALAIETDAEDEEPIRERLLRGIASYNNRSRKPYALGMSLGVIHLEHDTQEPLEDLLTRADAPNAPTEPTPTQPSSGSAPLPPDPGTGSSA
jgi:diguanylate cyclase (GGDEF)-like protein